MPLSIHSKIRDIVATEQGKAVLEKYMPKLTRIPAFQMTYEMSFIGLGTAKAWKLTELELITADAELRAITES